MTPAAGPDSSALIALARIASAGKRPPFDCITLKRPLKPLLDKRAANRVM